jgi:pimeloyl-ACP methyl ester carboxylesterase
MRLGGKVSKVVLYDASYCSNTAEQQEYTLLSQELDALLGDGKHDEALRFFLEGIGFPAEVIDFMQESPDWATMVALAPTLAYDVRLTHDLPPVERASRLTTPTQIIVGEQSPASLHDVADQLSKAIANATCVQLQGEDHMANPEAILPVFSNFLKS